MPSAWPNCMKVGDMLLTHLNSFENISKLRNWSTIESFTDIEQWIAHDFWNVSYVFDLVVGIPRSACMVANVFLFAA